MKSAINKAPIFFRECVPATQLTDLAILVVTHLIPDRPPFLEALLNLATQVAVVPKRKSIHEATYQDIKNRFDVLEWSREDLQSADIVETVADWTRGKKLVILDIGGYFANILEAIKKRLGNKFLGVIEDTENGLQKYLAIKRLCCPVVSVARSPLKLAEDYLVGQSIIFASEAILRECDEILQGKSAVVFGYGKIGRSIAHVLHMKNIQTQVVELDPIRCIEALSHGFKVSKKKSALSKADVLFCATGNHSLAGEDFFSLKDGCFVASVTSSDDELDLEQLELSSTKTRPHRHVTMHEFDGKRIFLLNHGNAVNFAYRSGNGAFIYLVHAEMIQAISFLHTQSESRHFQIHEMSVETRNSIAASWLSVFSPTR